MDSLVISVSNTSYWLLKYEQWRAATIPDSLKNFRSNARLFSDENTENTPKGKKPSQSPCAMEIQLQYEWETAHGLHPWSFRAPKIIKTGLPSLNLRCSEAVSDNTASPERLCLPGQLGHIQVPPSSHEGCEGRVMGACAATLVKHPRDRRNPPALSPAPEH